MLQVHNRTSCLIDQSEYSHEIIDIQEEDCDFGDNIAAETDSISELKMQNDSEQRDFDKREVDSYAARNSQTNNVMNQKQIQEYQE